ncbi:GNS1/SUR4 family [Nesidiocoris tenuis]|uniref:Elongation of very long chain fatty acids protein n=1 Tax=Nesidiocoris tenuis TaxID=355587 RepID=A0ABN7BB41_9HEMI|nr:GNS1/SUR4 family [Nesidiocoris tenuis]
MSIDSSAFGHLALIRRTSRGSSGRSYVTERTKSALFLGDRWPSIFPVFQGVRTLCQDNIFVFSGRLLVTSCPENAVSRLLTECTQIEAKSISMNEAINHRAGMAHSAIHRNATEDGFQSFSDFWNYIFFELGDKRTNHWPLLGSPIPGLTILALYLLFVKWIGPKMMENRKPFELKEVLIVYNAYQVFFSMYLVYEALDGLWLNKYSCFRCESVEWEANEYTMRICRGFYVYFIAKLTELLDTVFFVLRKKDNQITFLHLYHHTMMPMAAWGTTKYYPGGHPAFIGSINSFVHVIMYAYYMFAAMGPQFQKYLWWKKWLTTLQLGQFCLAFLHYMQILFHKDCNIPKWSVIIVLPNAIFFYYLFNDFYEKAYGPREQKKKENGIQQPIENGKKLE